MYSRTIKLFAPNDAADAEYTCPANVRCRLNKVTATVTGATARALTAYITPSGQTAGDGYAVYKDYAIGPEQVVTLADLIGHVLDAGDKLEFAVDAGTDCIIHAAGTEVTI